MVRSFTYKDFNNYNSFTSPYFDFQRSQTENRNDEYTEMLKEQMMRKNQPQFEPQDNSRSFLDRSLDALMTVNYAVAGGIDGFADGKGGRTPWEGVVDGFKAGNPFGDGYDKGETTFSDVLETSGWKPESGFGKVAKGVAGFGLDVLLDPTTYLTGGTSALVKGTGKVGKAGQTLSKVGDDATRAMHFNRRYDELIGKGVSHNEAIGLATTRANNIKSPTRSPVKMTNEMAENIIKQQTTIRGVSRTADEMAKSSEKLAKQWNDIIGIRETGKITWGIGNLPFMRKKWQDKVFTLGSDEALRKFSDATRLSSLYAGVRNNIYGRQIGRLFSNKSGLYKLANEEPSKLWEALEYVELTKGMKLNKHREEKAIRDFSKSLKLTPQENKEIIELLEDKTIWNKVKQTKVASGASKVKDAFRRTQAKKAEAQAEYDDILNMKKSVSSDLRKTEEGLTKANKMLDELESNRASKLATIDANYIEETDKLKTLINEYRDELQKLNRETDELENVVRDPKEEIDETYNAFKAQRDQRNAEMKERSNLQSQRVSTTANARKKNSRRKYIDSEKNKKLQREIAKINKRIGNETKKKKDNADFLRDLKKREAELSENIRLAKENGRATKQLTNNLEKVRGEISNLDSPVKTKDGVQEQDVISKLREEKNSVEAQIRENTLPTGNRNVETSDVYDDLSRGLNQSIDDESMRMAEDMTGAETKIKLEEQLSNHLFGDTMSLRGTSDDGIEQIMTKLNEEGIDRTVKFIKENPNMFSEMQRDINKIVAKELNYTNWHKDGFSVPLSRLMGKESSYANGKGVNRLIDEASEMMENGKFDDDQIREFERLMNKKFKRDFMRSELRKKTPEELAVIKTNQANSEMMEEFYKTEDEMIDLRRQFFTDDDYSHGARGATEQHTPVKKQKSDGTWEYTVSKNKANPIREHTRGTGRSEYESVHKVDNTTFSDFVDKSIDSGVFKPGKVQDALNGKNKTFQRYLERLYEESRVTGMELYGRPLKEMTPNQLKSAIGQSQNKIAGKTQSLTRNEMKKANAESIQRARQEQAELRKTYEPTSAKSAKRRYDTSDIAKSSVARKEELSKAMQETAKHISDLSNVSYKEKQKVYELYDKKTKDLKNRIIKGEEQAESFKKALDAFDEEELEKLAKSIDEFDEEIRNMEATETYAEMKHTPDKIGADDGGTDAGRIMLDEKASSEKIANLVKTLRDKFNIMGENEVAIGRMTEEQFNKMLYHYLPHIPTDVGRQYLDSVKEVTERNAQITHDLGYGLRYNPYALHRKIKGKVGQINKQFEDKLKGKNLFSENVADIYLERALKHTELMYDDHYMRNMMDVFGKDIPRNGEVEAGYKAVMNYGMMKETFQDVASMKVSTEISREVGQYIRDNHARFSSMARKSNRNRDEFIDAQVDSFIKRRFPSDEIDKMWSNYHKGAIKNSELPSKILDDQALPMVELADKNIKGIQNTWDEAYNDHLQVLRSSQQIAVKNRDNVRLEELAKRFKALENRTPPQMKQVNDVIVTEANKARKLQRAKDQNSFLQIYDKFTHFMKLNQTVVNPGFHSRNKWSNMFNNWLVVGRDTNDPKFQLGATTVARYEGDAKRIENAIKSGGMKGDAVRPITIAKPHDSLKEAVNITSGQLHWSDAYELAIANGVIDTGQFARDIGAGASSKGLFKKARITREDGSQISLDPTDTENFALYKKGTEVGSVVENSDRLSSFVSMLRNGASIDEASTASKSALFDYSDLTSFETGVMKRIFPFYTWLRKNARLQVGQLIESPEKYRTVAKVMNGIEHSVPSDERINDAFVSSWADGWLQLPSTTDEDGEQGNPLMLNPNLPFMDLNRLPDPTNIDESIRTMFAQTVPQIKNPIELGMNFSAFFNGEIAKEGENKGIEYAKYIGNQFALGNVAGGFFDNDSFTDFMLHTINSTVGIKMNSFNYEQSKYMILEEMAEGKDKTPIDTAVQRAIGASMDLINQPDSAEVQGVENAVGSFYEGVGIRDDLREKANKEDFRNAVIVAKWFNGNLPSEEIAENWDVLKKYLESAERDGYELQEDNSIWHEEYTYPNEGIPE